MTGAPDRRLAASSADQAFDRLLPGHLRDLSPRHWTPVEVAIRAAALLDPTRATRILDVGSGAGKLCVVGAMSGMGQWCGVEQHEPLVHTARMLASTLGVAERASFMHGDALAADWDAFDVVYLYNPFESPLHDVDPRQHAVDFPRRVAHAQVRLAALRPGVRVVTLDGFGGAMPASYDLAYQERISSAGLSLALWVQRATRHAPEQRT